MQFPEFFDSPGQIRYTRVDTAATVTVSARLDREPADRRMVPLLQRYLAGSAAADETTRFQSLWQGRVRTLLVDHADDPDVVVVRH